MRCFEGEVLKTVYVLLTMDCETARMDVTPYATRMSSSGPADYRESEQSIRGYVEAVAASGFPVTLFAHPEVALDNAALLLDLQDRGACLGLHLHPYKLKGEEYRYDLGAYSASGQREILQKAMAVWASALGQTPRYFRAGYFSGNDCTFGVLHELRFRGGSLSNPGRILPSHCSVWAGAEVYPHRAHFGFRHIRGGSDFINVPVSVAFVRPVAVGHAGEQGYEWPYIPHSYDHRKVIRDILERFRDDAPRFGTIVTDTHNDQDYTDPGHPARVNLDLILRSVREFCEEMEMQPVGVTLDTLCSLVLSEGDDI